MMELLVPLTLAILALVVPIPQAVIIAMITILVLLILASLEKDAKALLSIVTIKMLAQEMFVLTENVSIP
jgi:hypothetical protein